MRSLVQWILIICICFTWGGQIPCALADADQVIYVGDRKQQQGNRSLKRTEERYGCGQRFRPIRVGTFSTNPPFGWVDVESSNVIGSVDRYVSRGFGVEMFKALAQSKGLYVTQVGYPSYQRTLRALSRGDIDVLVGSYYDPALSRSGNGFVIPSFFQNAIVAVFLKGHEKPIQNFDDLIGLKGVVRMDESFYHLIYKGLSKRLTIKQVSNAEDAFRMLLNKEVDYMLSSPYAAEAEARRFQMEQNIEFSEKALYGPEMFFVFSYHSDCRKLRKTFASLLKEAKKEPEKWQRLLVDYVNQWGKRFENMPGLSEIMQGEKEGKTIEDLIREKEIKKKERLKGKTLDIKLDPQSDKQKNASQTEISNEKDPLKQKRVISHSESVPVASKKNSEDHKQ